MEPTNQYCVIMAGGIGSRFWPLSTTNHPKQFQDILGTGRTMIQQTFDRIKRTVPNHRIFVITNKEYVNLCHQQLPELPESNIIGEPSMKNTAACNLYMAKKIEKLDPKGILLVLPADHLILNENQFEEKVKQAFAIASINNHLITMGIQPTRPDTGYGYIKYKINESNNCHKVSMFTEKPDLATAKRFLQEGDYLWNAGIFIWNVEAILAAYREHLPEMAIEFKECVFNSQTEESDLKIIYSNIQNISIDNGILEKADNVYVIPADIGWSDLGTWTSLFENAIKDENYNSLNSDTILTYNSSNNIIRLNNRNKTAVIDGLDNYIVVDTEHSLLICPISNDQLIKNYASDVAKLE